jgi:hypothetical protein
MTRSSDLHRSDTGEAGIRTATQSGPGPRRPAARNGMAARRGRTDLLIAVGFVAVAFLVLINPAAALGVAVLTCGAGIAGYRPRGTASVLLLLYLAPLFALARVYSYVGVAPIYLPEVLLISALVISAPQWWEAYRTDVPKVYKSLTIAFATIGFVATVLGVSRGYPNALKGLVFVVYPVLSGPAAAWISLNREKWQRILTIALAACPLGLAVLLATDKSSVVSAAYGFYLSGLLGLMMCREPSRLRTWLLIEAWIGVALLGSSGSRGPTLTVLIAFAILEYTLRRTRHPSTMRLRPFLFVGAAALVAMVGLAGLTSTRLPGFGSAIDRTRQALTDPGSASEANVAFRIELWQYSLRTALHEGPILGMGFGRPFDLRFREVDLSSKDTGGPHNSFVAICYYMGFPALGLFIAIIAVAVRRSLKLPRSTMYPMQLAWLAAGLVTMFTNVALEAPFIAGPLWLLLGWCALDRHESVSPVAVKATVVR